MCSRRSPIHGTDYVWMYMDMYCGICVAKWSSYGPRHFERCNHAAYGFELFGAAAVNVCSFPPLRPIRTVGNGCATDRRISCPTLLCGAGFIFWDAVRRCGVEEGNKRTAAHRTAPWEKAGSNNNNNKNGAYKALLVMIVLYCCTTEYWNNSSYRTTKRRHRPQSNTYVPWLNTLGGYTGLTL